jgi:hypothetical protein
MPFQSDDKAFRIYSATSTGTGGVAYDINFSTSIRWTTIADFVTYFNSLLTAVSAPFTVTYTTNSNKLTITHNTANTAMYIPRWSYTNANFRLGFTSVVGLGVAAPGAGLYASVTADGFPNVFLRCNSVYVTSNISVDSNNDSNVGNIIARIPITGNYGELVNYENVHSEFSAPVFTERIKDVSIQLLDENYQPLALPNNAYFTITIGVEY